MTLDTQARTIAKNTGALTVSAVAQKLLGFLFIIYFTRHYPVADLGKYALVVAMVAVFDALSNLGLHEHLVREISKDRQNAGRYLVNSLSVLLVSSAIGAGLMAMAVWILKYPADTSRMLYIATLYLIPSAIVIVCGSVFRAYERMELQAVPGIVATAFQVLASVVLLAMGHGIVVLAVIIVLSRVVAALLSLYFLARMRLPLTFRFDATFGWRLVRASRDFYILAILVILFTKTSPIFLSKLATERDVGLYSAAHRLMQMLILIGTAYGASLYPPFSRAYQLSASALERLGRKALQYAWILPLPIVVGTTILADQIVSLLYGQRFLASALALQILIWGLIPKFINPVLTRIMFASRNERVSVRIAFSKLVFFVLLSFLLIPRFGYLGAALATVLAFGLEALANYVFVHRHILRINFLDIASRPAVAVTGLTIFLLTFRGIGLIPLVLASAVLYGVSLVLFGGISREDIAAVWRWAPKKR